jgi:preprotein translocase subunit Sec61beta
MSSKKKNAPLPASSAGLLRFFEDETKGAKIKPEIVLGVTSIII